MKKQIGYIGIVFCLISCTEFFLGGPPSNSPVSTFDEFWKGVDLTWPEFASKRVNWDSLYAVYRPQVNSATNEVDLTKILSGLLLNLKDSHTTIYPKTLSPIGYFPNYPKNFYGINWIRSNYPSTYKGKNNHIVYGMIHPDIGYIYISTFSNEKNEYTIIDNILSEFGEVKGVIIDIRNNGGGGSDRSEVIASRFADQGRTYAFTRFRISRQRDLMGDFISAYIEPSGITFHRKVAVLTNRYSYSATEDFILMMKSFPTSIQIGDYTGGGSGSRPILKELPNGWTYRVSSRLICDLNKVPISNGIAPNIFIQTAKSDSLKGKDSIIESALIELLK